jgi:phosphoribosylformylglycinamidine synthase
VQIGNAVEEKRLLDAILACREAGLIRAITDCGAGGFSSAIGEMGEAIGAEVHLDRAPLKYPGLAPWEVFLSESQERMVMAVAPEDVPEVLAICALYNVEAVDVGSFEASGTLRVYWAGEPVGELDMRFLHDGWPKRVLEGTWSPRRGARELPALPRDEAACLAAVRAVLSDPNVASKEPIVRQYDHTVQGMSALPPFGGPEGDAPSDAAVLAPLYGKPYGMVIAHGLNPVLNTFDPYWGGLWAAAEAMANLVAAGGNPREVSLIDNFIWPMPDEESLGGLDRAVDACVDVMNALGRPFISGKDSLSSTYRYPDGRHLKIPPVLCISVFGRIDDVARSMSSDFKRPGSALVLVGAPDHGGMGGSLYLAQAGLDGERPPRVDLALLPRTLDAVYHAIRAGRVRSAHDVSEGGLAVALAEMGFGGDIGAEVDVGGLSERPDVSLFNETSGVLVVEVEDPEAAADLFRDVPHAVIGRTIAEPELRVREGGRALFTAGLGELQGVWEGGMRGVFHAS